MSASYGDDDMTRGFPRPRITLGGYEGLPTPYVASSPSSPGTLHIDRNTQSAEHFLCALCGLEITEETCGIASGEPEDGVTTRVNYDHGVTHPRCAVMTARMCPSFRDGMVSTRMAMWIVRSDVARDLVVTALHDTHGVPLDEFGERERVL